MGHALKVVILLSTAVTTVLAAPLIAAIPGLISHTNTRKGILSLAPRDSSTLSTVAISGIVIASLAAAGLIIYGIFWFCLLFWVWKIRNLPPTSSAANGGSLHNRFLSLNNNSSSGDMLDNATLEAGDTMTGIPGGRLGGRDSSGMAHQGNHNQNNHRSFRPPQLHSFSVNSANQSKDASVVELSSTVRRLYESIME
ncbi:hypothetical protein HK100_000747 [Physocladia obscura]|uniref:Uncharacterized protein n=1 Tax=Physocladia obscura TaxID=109957 RepID=A0AAD5SY46_9FUNG|nr:hypothetical protein HK100_000747 [Physocladia obscura]